MINGVSLFCGKHAAAPTVRRARGALNYGLWIMGYKL